MAPTSMGVARPAPSAAARELWRRWTLGTAAGELVGFAAPALVMAAGTMGGWNDTAQLLSILLSGAVEGAALGLAQFIALRPAFPALSGRAWVLGTALGAVVAYLLAMIAVALFGAGTIPVVLLVLAGVALGAGFLVSIGLSQWLVLRKHLRHAGWWIPANAAAWTIGVAVPFGTFALVPDGAPFWAWATAGIAGGVLMGLVVGALTGMALVRLWRPAG